MDDQKTLGNPAGLALAIVHAGGLRLIGKVDKNAVPGDARRVHKAMELRAGVVGALTPQGIISNPVLSACLIDGADDFVDVDVLITAIRWFDNMTKDEVNKYMRVLEAEEDEVQKKRAKKLGITLAKDLPKGGPHGGLAS